MRGLLDRPRFANFLGALACAALMAYALFAEKVLGLPPCPLCMFQRVGVIALGIVFLVAAIHDPKRWGGRVYALLIVAAAGIAIGVAVRHLYIQSLPPGTVPACGATLDYMLDVFPLLDVVKQVLTGGGECAKIDWRFLGLTMPAWVLISASALAIYGVVVNARARKPSIRFR